mgnify:CR=1 FL=1
MASGSAQKLKVLHVMDILRTETDPEHGLTMPQLIVRPKALCDGYAGWLKEILGRYGKR